MQVKLNCWRGEYGPGDVVELPDAEAAPLLAHGAAHLVDDSEDQPADQEAASAPRVIKGTATLTATSETAHTT